MRFAPSAEQRQFAQSLHDLLGDAGTPAVARAVAHRDLSTGRAVWKQLAEVGVPALLVPEHWGGLGAECGDVVTAFEELGRHAVPGPLVESAVVVPALLALLADGHPDLARRWLPGLAEGEHVVTLAHPLCPRVVGADWAGDVLLVHGEELRLLPASSLRRQRSVDPSRQIDMIIAHDTGDLLACGPEVVAAAGHAVEAGTLAVSAQLLGAARMMLDMSVEYAVQRQQFGRQIGQFQAVKHHLADLAVAVEFTRPLVHGAAAALDGGSAEATRDVSAAKVAASRTADRAARTALQVHGAIGYTQEHALSVWLLYVRALVNAWGTPSHHRARVLAALASDGGARGGEG
ncbi:MAG: acyl-CoA/acyl-ACP dehydrogenase [Actinomycetota bacterium]|nr:acyl-CoA/acyl-ACP dehydrogenase [Actinomycetota bacterium]